MQKTVVDAKGNVTVIPLTQKEIAEREAQALPTPLPSVCSPWQIRKALNQMGLRASVEAAVAASDDQALKDGWEFATEFRSDDAFVLKVGAALGKTTDETRDLIAFAVTL